MHSKTGKRQLLCFNLPFWRKYCLHSRKTTWPVYRLVPYKLRFHCTIQSATRQRRWRGRGKTRVNRQEFTQWRAQVLCQCLFPHWYRVILSTNQSVTKSACLFIQPCVLLCLFIALRSRLQGQLEFLLLFFALDCCHVAEAVFVTMAPTVTTQGHI